MPYICFSLHSCLQEANNLRESSCELITLVADSVYVKSYAQKIPSFTLRMTIV